MKIKGITLTGILGLLSVLFLVSPTPAMAARGSFTCKSNGSFCSAVNVSCETGYQPDAGYCSVIPEVSCAIQGNQDCIPIPGFVAPGGGVVGASGNITCGSDGTSINTAIGCIPFGDQNLLIGFFLKWGIGIGGGIAFLLIIVAGFQIMTSRGDPNRLKAGQELMTSAIAGLLLLIFSLAILQIIGFDILKIDAFK